MHKISVVFAIIFVAAGGVGACGGKSGCCRPIVHVSCNQNTCQQGYSCGRYGCARVRHRTHAAITNRVDGVLIDSSESNSTEQAINPAAEKHLMAGPHGNETVPYEKFTNPNYIFRTCCEQRGLPDACLRHCHFNTYTAQTLENMYRKRDACPLEAANEIQYCAAQGMDHRRCCANSGVGSTLAGNKCLAFCDQRPNRFTPLDVSYLPCYDIFESMKTCFYTEIQQRAVEKFGGKKAQFGGEF